MADLLVHGNLLAELVSEGSQLTPRARAVYVEGWQRAVMRVAADAVCDRGEQARAAELERRSVPVAPTADRVPGAAQQHQHDSEDEQDDSNGEQDGELRDEQPDDEQGDTENDHAV